MRCHNLRSDLLLFTVPYKARVSSKFMLMVTANFTMLCVYLRWVYSTDTLMIR